MEDQLAILHGLWGEPDGWSYDGLTGIQVEGALFRPRPVDVPGPPADPDRRGATADHHRRPGLAPVVPAGGPLRRRVQPVVVVTGQGRRGRSRARRRVRRRSGATRRRSRARRWPACSSAATADEVARARARRCWPRSVTDADDGEAWLEERRDRWVYGTPDEARAQLERFAEAGMERIMLQDFLPVGPRHDRPHGRGARRAGLTAGRWTAAPRLHPMTVATNEVRFRSPASSVRHGVRRATRRVAARRRRGTSPCAGCRGDPDARAQPAASAPRGSVDVAVDRVGVDAAGTGESLGQRLQRGGARQQRGDGGGHAAGASGTTIRPVEVGSAAAPRRPRPRRSRPSACR